MASYCGPMPSKSTAPDPYQAEDDHRTLSRAADIQEDAQRMAGVRKHQAKVSKSLTKVGRMIGAKRTVAKGGR